MFFINFLFYEHSWDTSMGLLIIMLIVLIQLYMDVDDMNTTG